MEKYIPLNALVREIERLISNGQIKLQESQESNDYESYVAWAEHIATCIKVLSFLDTLEVIDPYEQCVQYDSIKAGIQAHAETYSFNIESKLSNQLTTEEQQELWRKEIEQACVSGGEAGVELARDPRYKENIETKKVDLKKESELIANGIMIGVQANKYHTCVYNTARCDFNHSHLMLAARKGIELGLKAQKGDGKYYIIKQIQGI